MYSFDRMGVPEPQAYDLDLLPEGGYTVCSAENGSSQFHGFCALDDCPKIYMVIGRKGATVYYVGQTTQSMKARFKDGFRTEATRRYAWADESVRLRLLVWDITSNGLGKELSESVEAELVFCVRVYQRAWPKGQTSISFHHIVNQSGEQTATQISLCLLQDYFDDYNSRLTPPQPELSGDQQKTLKTISGLIFPIGVGYKY